MRLSQFILTNPVVDIGVAFQGGTANWFTGYTPANLRFVIGAEYQVGLRDKRCAVKFKNIDQMLDVLQSELEFEQASTPDAILIQSIAAADEEVDLTLDEKTRVLQRNWLKKEGIKGPATCMVVQIGELMAEFLPPPPMTNAERIANIKLAITNYNLTQTWDFLRLSNLDK